MKYFRKLVLWIVGFTVPTAIWFAAIDTIRPRTEIPDLSGEILFVGLISITPILVVGYFVGMWLAEYND